MKAYYALTLGLFSVLSAARAQDEWVVFQNTGLTFPTPADRRVYRDFVGGELLLGSNFVAGLWYVLGTDPDAVDGRLGPERGMHVGPLGQFRSNTTSAPGTWLIQPPASSQVFLPTALPLAATMLQVRVWDAVKYGSFGAALAAGEYGVSAPFLFQIPPSGSNPQSHYMDNLRAFALVGLGRGVLVEDLVVAEGSNGVVQANLQVHLTGPQSETVQVDFATQDGTALAGQDYVATNGTVVFQPGETHKVVPVLLTADGPPEPDEVFYMQLSNPVNAVLGKARATCTITEVRVAEIRFDTVVSFNTVVGHRYIVERTSDALTWEPVPGATNVIGTGEILSAVDRNAGCMGMRAYRARLLQ